MAAKGAVCQKGYIEAPPHYQNLGFGERRNSLMIEWFDRINITISEKKTMIYVLLTLNALIMIGLPVVLGIWLVRRYKVGWSIYFIGMLGFVASQVLHIPFNQFILNPIIGDPTVDGTPIGQIAMAAILLGLSAGSVRGSHPLPLLPVAQGNTPMGRRADVRCRLGRH